MKVSRLARKRSRTQGPQLLPSLRSSNNIQMSILWGYRKGLASSQVSTSNPRFQSSFCGPGSTLAGEEQNLSCPDSSTEMQLEKVYVGARAQSLTF